MSKDGNNNSTGAWALLCVVCLVIGFIGGLYIANDLDKIDDLEPEEVVPIIECDKCLDTHEVIMIVMVDGVPTAVTVDCPYCGGGSP